MCQSYIRPLLAVYAMVALRAAIMGETGAPSVKSMPPRNAVTRRCPLAVFEDVSSMTDFWWCENAVVTTFDLQAMRAVKEISIEGPAVQRTAIHNSTSHAAPQKVLLLGATCAHTGDDAGRTHT